jgi:hypothetical protein
VSLPFDMLEPVRVESRVRVLSAGPSSRWTEWRVVDEFAERAYLSEGLVSERRTIGDWEHETRTLFAVRGDGS